MGQAQPALLAEALEAVLELALSAYEQESEGQTALAASAYGQACSKLRYLLQVQLPGSDSHQLATEADCTLVSEACRQLLATFAQAAQVESATQQQRGTCPVDCRSFNQDCCSCKNSLVLMRRSSVAQDSSGQTPLMPVLRELMEHRQRSSTAKCPWQQHTRLRQQDRSVRKSHQQMCRLRYRTTLNKPCKRTAG